MKVKKLIVLTLLAILLLSTFACGGGGEEEATPTPTLEHGAYLVYEVDYFGVGHTTPALALAEMEEIVKEHIYAYGFTRPVEIERIGEDRISIFLPDFTDIEEAHEMVGDTAQFNLREFVGGQWVIAEAMGPDEQIKPLTGAYLAECHASRKQGAEPWLCHAELNVRFVGPGAALLDTFIERNEGETVGIFIGDALLVQVQIPEGASNVLEIAPVGCALADYLAETINQAALPLSLRYIGGYVYPPATEPIGPEPTPTPAAMPEFGYLSYTDEVNGFSMWCPQDWYVDEETDMSLRLLSSRSAPVGQVWWFPEIRVVKFDYSGTLSQAFDDLKAYWEEELRGYAAVSEERVTVGGVGAIKHVYDFKYEYVTERTVDLYLVKGGFAYLIGCTAGTSVWDEYESTFDTVIDSFRVLD